MRDSTQTAILNASTRALQWLHKMGRMCQDLAEKGHKDVKPGTQTISVSATYEWQCEVDLDPGATGEGEVKALRQGQMEKLRRLGAHASDGGDAMAVVGSVVPPTWKEGREYFVGGRDRDVGSISDDIKEARTDPGDESLLTDDNASLVPILSGLLEWASKLSQPGMQPSGENSSFGGRPRMASPMPVETTFLRGELVVVSLRCSCRTAFASRRG